MNKPRERHMMIRQSDDLISEKEIVQSGGRRGKILRARTIPVNMLPSHLEHVNAKTDAGISELTRSMRETWKN